MPLTESQRYGLKFWKVVSGARPTTTEPSAETPKALTGNISFTFNGPRLASPSGSVHRKVGSIPAGGVASPMTTRPSAEIPFALLEWPPAKKPMPRNVATPAKVVDADKKMTSAMLKFARCVNRSINCLLPFGRALQHDHNDIQVCSSMLRHIRNPHGLQSSGVPAQCDDDSYQCVPAVCVGLNLFEALSKFQSHTPRRSTDAGHPPLYQW